MKTVLSASSAYNRKYYFNSEFNGIPKEVQDEIRILSTLFTEENGGIFTLGFLQDGSLYMETEKAENDMDYDEIGARLAVSNLEAEKKDLFHGLSLWYVAFMTGDGRSIIEGLNIKEEK